MRRSTLRKIKDTVVGTLVFGGLIVIVGLAEGWCARYTRGATVTRVENSIVTVVDTTDNVWEFEGAGFEEGQEVTLKMFTNHTDSNIYDDVIEDVKIVK